MDTTFPQRLLEERKRLGLTQKELGQWGGVTRLAQWKYEHGENSPNIEYLLNLKDHPVDVVYLLLGQRLSSDLLDWRILEIAIKSFLRSFLHVRSANSSRDEIFNVLESQLQAIIHSEITKLRKEQPPSSFDNASMQINWPPIW